MTITLNDVVPVPLKDKLQQRSSDIWNQELSFQAGQWIKVKAPSGTGKTTLIHSLYKLRDDYTGTIRWDEYSLKDIAPEQIANYRQEKISIVFQDMRLFPHLTAFENIELKRVLQEPYYSREKIQEMAAELSVDHVLHQQASLCSYGEQQRIAIIRAMIQPFSFLIMDEPFSHLDKTNAGKAATLIARECSNRKAGLLITDLHDDTYFSYDQIRML